MKFNRSISRYYAIIFPTVLIFLAIYSLNVTSSRGFARSDADARKPNSSKTLSDIVEPRTDIVLSAVLDAQVHSEAACAKFQATIGGTNAPWDLRLDKFGGCASSANPPAPPQSLVHWTVRVVAEGAAFTGSLCRPRNLSKPGYEECYGDFKLPSAPVLQKLLSQDDNYVALLMAGLLEAAPITTTTSYNSPPGRRQYRFPGGLARSTTLQAYWIQFANDGEEIVLTPRNRPAPARKYFWGKKQGFTFRKEAFQVELLKPEPATVAASGEATVAEQPAAPVTPPTPEPEVFVADAQVKDPVLINIQVDPAYHSEEACGLLRDAFVSTSSPWGITLGNVVTCSSISPAPILSQNAHYWRLGIAPREGRAHVTLCRPVSASGSEECYGHIKLAPESKVVAALKQPSFVTLLTAAVLEASPVSAYMGNGSVQPKRDARLPAQLSNPPRLSAVQFGYDRGGLRLNISRLRRNATVGTHFLAVYPSSAARNNTFQRAIDQTLEKLDLAKLAPKPAATAAAVPTAVVAVPGVVKESAAVVPAATPLAVAAVTVIPTVTPTAAPTVVPTLAPTVAPTPVQTPPPPLPTALPRPTTTPVPVPTLQPLAPKAVGLPLVPNPSVSPTTARPTVAQIPVPPAPQPAAVSRPAPAPAKAPAVVQPQPAAPAPVVQAAEAKPAASAVDIGHTKAAGLILNVAGLPVPRANQKRFSSVLTYGFDAKLWSHESTRFGLRAARARHAYSLSFTPDATPIDDEDSESTSANEKTATAVRYENTIGLSFHQAVVVAQRRLQLELHGGEVSYTTQWSYERALTSKIFPALSNAAYNYGFRLLWVPWLENSGDVFGLEAEWQKGSSLTGRVLGLHLGWRVSYHGDDIPTSVPDLLIDLYGKVQIGTYKTPNPLSGVQEDIRTNTILVGTSVSFM
ncbi:MAG: hypothetical protein FJY29_13600 [Betaproteobacteria bacterium]|nr:hypothetical protein [Betaproteobacteria bacterium]